MELHRSPTPRNGDRRAGERRTPERAGPGRRRGERRKSTATAAPVGAKGLMQLMPVIAKEYGALDPLDAKQNVFAGVKYLSDLLDRYNGNVSMALAGYNAGPTAVKRFRGIPPYRETRGYVHRIQNLIAEGIKS